MDFGRALASGMGGLWRRLLVGLGIKKAKATLLVVGLDNSGKTTLARPSDFAADAQDEDYSRDQEHVLNVQPTIGFRVEVESPFSKGLEHRGHVGSAVLQGALADVSPPPPPPHTIFLPPDALFLLFLSISRLPRYYEDVQGIMFVVDARPEALAEAKDALVTW